MLLRATRRPSLRGAPLTLRWLLAKASTTTELRTQRNATHAPNAHHAHHALVVAQRRSSPASPNTPHRPPPSARSCAPAFELRNCFVPDVRGRRYDGVHVGAACAEAQLPALVELLKPGGRMVARCGSCKQNPASTARPLVSACLQACVLECFAVLRLFVRFASWGVRFAPRRCPLRATSASSAAAPTRTTQARHVKRRSLALGPRSEACLFSSDVFLK